MAPLPAAEGLTPLKPAEDACLLIADITGYTGYLTSTELEHAQDVVADFLTQIAAALEPVFEVVETEGDAVFVVAPLAGLNGQLVLDIVDACYFEFRRHARAVVLRTTCQCNACRQIPTLDLKFVVHAGPIVRSTVVRRTNVSGPAVIAVHRLLKSSAALLVGGHAYLLVTEAALPLLGLEGLGAHGLRSVESFEHLGELPVHVVDMEQRWQSAEAAAGLQVRREEAGLVVESRLPAPPATVWEHIFDPRKRMAWQTSLSAIEEDHPTGRREVGTAIHCAHGEGTFSEWLVEWRPFERFTWEVEVAGYGRLRNTITLRPDGEGTRLEDMAAAPANEAQRELWPQLRDMLAAEGEHGYSRLAQILAAEKARPRQP